ncbi:hypothetical protein BC938DRAFT_483926 [Jimgerdemannia flammicorona]|uniref:Uncharacterized protein n=1 Tax=Jimgerdemannia flammicorona TaxID=994334 RepID=A0A433QAW6_9FUNG|nr:hypothetical protein BC938DRAFT_483926 [Jimgerdemannia flammicorona]
MSEAAIKVLWARGADPWKRHAKNMTELPIALYSHRQIRPWRKIKGDGTAPFDWLKVSARNNEGSECSPKCPLLCSTIMVAALTDAIFISWIGNFCREWYLVCGEKTIPENDHGGRHHILRWSGRITSYV